MNNINIKIRNGETEIYSVGHCDSAIVCSAISAIMQTTILGLVQLSEQFPNEIKLDLEDKRVFEGDKI